MDPNTLLGGLLGAVGLADIVFARVLGERLPPIGRQVLSLGGVGLIAVGSLLAFGILRIL